MSDVEPGTAGKETNLELPGGIKVSTKGYHFGNVLQIVVAGLLAVILVQLYEMKTEAKVAAKELSSSANSEHTKLGDAINRGTEAQVEMNYILTLAPEDRAKLRLAMPESMRRKLLDR